MTNPFVIWAAPRSGSTNLLIKFRWLLENRNSVFNEPFNLDIGEYLDITSQYLNQNFVSERIHEVIDTGIIFKECVGSCCPELLADLVKECAEHGYKQIILYRKNSLSRLLSFYYSCGTGIWSLDHKRNNIKKSRVSPFYQKIIQKYHEDPALFEKRLFRRRLPISKLIEIEKKVIQQLQFVENQILINNGSYMSISYEDIYESESSSKLAEMLNYLGFDASTDVIQGIVRSGNQETRDQYKNFKGISELAQRLSEEISPFQPNQ